MHLKGIVHGQYSAESLCDQVSVRTQIAVKTAFHLYILFLRNETNEKKQNSFWNKKTTTWWTLLQKNQIRTGKNLNTTSNCIFRILRFDHIERARTVFLSTDCYGQRRTRFAIVFRIVFLFSIIFFFLRAWCCKTEQQPRRQRHCQREKNIKKTSSNSLMLFRFEMRENILWKLNARRNSYTHQSALAWSNDMKKKRIYVYQVIWYMLRFFLPSNALAQPALIWEIARAHILHQTTVRLHFFL